MVKPEHIADNQRFDVLRLAAFITLINIPFLT